MNLPNIKQLRYYLALEEKGHFGKAAEACFVSQSAFSVAIRELESLLNVQLVDRTNRNVTITSIGREVAAQARLVLKELEVLTEVARGNRAPLSGKLELGVIPSIAPFLLPQILPALRQSYHSLELYLREEITQEKSYREIALAWRQGSARADEFRQLGNFIRSTRENTDKA